MQQEKGLKEPLIPNGEFSHPAERANQKLQINTGKGTGIEDSFHSFDDGEPDTD